MKTNLRKFTTFLLILSVSIFVFMPCAHAYDDGDEYDSGTEGSLSWSYYLDGTLVISGSGALPDYDYAVGKVPGWLDYRQHITQLVISPGVTAVGENAFYQLAVSSCSLPEGLVSIGAKAFALCTGLTEINIPSTVSSIGAAAFYGCTALREIDFRGNAPAMASDCFGGVSAFVYPSCLTNGWDEASKSSYGGDLKWELHQYSAKTERTEPDCVSSGTEAKTCGRCGKTFIYVLPALGHKTEHIEAREPGCTEDGNREYYRCTVCGGCYSDSACLREVRQEDTVLLRKGHVTVVDEEVPPELESPGLTRGEHCGRCGAVLIEQREIPPLGYTVTFPGLSYMTAVDLGGVRYYLEPGGKLTLTEPPTALAAAYTFSGSSAAPNLQRPTGMRVYALCGENGSYEATPLSFLDNTALYGGCSIRCRGTAGMRALFMLDNDVMAELCMGGIEGFSLLGYGMVGAFGVRDSLTLNDSDVKKTATFVADGFDNPLLIEAGLAVYAGEFTCFSKRDYSVPFTIRPYMLLDTPWGTEVLYGPQVTRSMGFLAKLNADTYTKGTDEYNYIHAIIKAAK